ncbi:hypothetical protein F5144DRAFT_170479 [Chaetomium tenue]|uniref:Uncharacterized protein n=1 Tax=Chaetomium tenue TaxID=1854479 RepID=A0ACB7PAK4_9PEZI|nr:hypothetical protein F5144DRAFT_170479 [Chaetomium globosum]
MRTQLTAALAWPAQTASLPWHASRNRACRRPRCSALRRCRDQPLCSCRRRQTQAVSEIREPRGNHDPAVALTMTFELPRCHASPCDMEPHLTHGSQLSSHCCRRPPCCACRVVCKAMQSKDARRRIWEGHGLWCELWRLSGRCLTIQARGGRSARAVLCPRRVGGQRSLGARGKLLGIPTR